MEEELLLIKKAQQGDSNAFGEIYKKYFHKIYRYCKFNTNSQELAQDISQECFVKAWKKINNFRTEGNWSMQAFLFAIARNLIIDLSRKKKELKLDEFEDIESGENLYDTVEKKDDVLHIKNVLSKLDDWERQIIILRYFEDMSSQEVAEILGIKDGALRVRIHRVMQKLKDIYEGIYGKRN